MRASRALLSAACDLATRQDVVACLRSPPLSGCSGFAHRLMQSTKLETLNERATLLRSPHEPLFKVLRMANPCSRNLQLLFRDYKEPYMSPLKKVEPKLPKLIRKRCSSSQHDCQSPKPIGRFHCWRIGGSDLFRAHHIAPKLTRKVDRYSGAD